MAHENHTIAFIDFPFTSFCERQMEAFHNPAK